VRDSRPTVVSTSSPYQKHAISAGYMHANDSEIQGIKKQTQSFQSVVVISEFKTAKRGGIRNIELRTLGRFIGRWPNLVVIEGKL